MNDSVTRITPTYFCVRLLPGHFIKVEICKENNVKMHSLNPVYCTTGCATLKNEWVIYCNI